MANEKSGYFSGRFGAGFGAALGGGSGTDLEEELEQARAEARAYKDVVDRANKDPSPRATVLSVSPDAKSVLLAAGSGSILEVPMPAQTWAGDLRTGTSVKCYSSSMAILGIADPRDVVGEVATVRRDGRDGFCEVDHGGKVRVVRYGMEPAPETGDRVVLDSTGSVAVRSLGKDDSKFSYTGDTGVRWEDIGGLEKAKEDLREAVELPFSQAKLFAAYKKKIAKGVMLYGPPGCGKTMLAKAVATAIREIHGGDAAATGFVYVKGPELLDMFVGATEAQIRGLFARTRHHFKKHGYPAVLLIDEADALLGKRGARLNMGTETTTVPQFLSEMDGLHEAGCVVLLSTNRPDTLDPAVTREGRVDIKVRVTRPDRKGVEDIARLSLRGRPLNGSLEAIVSAGADAILSKENVLYEIVLKNRKVETFTLEDLVSGSMVDTVVEKALTLALREDADKGRDATGVSSSHVEKAAQAVFQQNLHTNHDDALEDFCARFRDDVQEIRRPKPETSRLILTG